MYTAFGSDLDPSGSRYGSASCASACRAAESPRGAATTLPPGNIGVASRHHAAARHRGREDLTAMRVVSLAPNRAEGNCE